MIHKRFRRVSYLAAVLLAAGMMTMTTGCGNTSNNGTQIEQQAGAYAHAKDMLDVIWDNCSQDFPVMGGNAENPVENGPGDLDIEDKDTMTNNLLIPEEVQKHITDAATLFHMMNANTYTGAAVKLEGMSVDDAAAKITDTFKNNQFMCGMPDKIVIYGVGNDLVYFFGVEEIVADAMEAAEKLEGAKLLVEMNYQ